MKKRIFLLGLCIPFCTFSASLLHHGCPYQGDVVQNKPHGKGVLTCADGRIYTGEFQHGKFHGKGQFISPNKPNVFLAPFGMRSGQVKGFVLVGQFYQGMATGLFKVYQNDKHLFNMNFKQGMLQKIMTTQ